MRWSTCPAARPRSARSRHSSSPRCSRASTAFKSRWPAPPAGGRSSRSRPRPHREPLRHRRSPAWARRRQASADSRRGSGRGNSAGGEAGFLVLGRLLLHRLDAILHRHDLGQDRHRDLGRRATADVQPDRPVQARDLAGRQLEQRQPFAPLLGVPARTERAHVEGRRLQRFDERQVVEFRVVRERHHRGVGIGPEGRDRIVGHAGQPGDLRQLQRGVVLLAGVADEDLEVERLRHLAEHARQLPGADHQQAVARAEYRARGLAVERERLAALRGRERGPAGFEVERAREELLARGALEHFVDPLRVGHRLLKQSQRASAGQAEARGLLLRHAVDDQRGLADPLAGLHALDEVVFDAPAGDRADHQAVVAQREQRPCRARRRAPGLDHGDQPHAAPLGEPVARMLEDFTIETVHLALLNATGKRRVRPQAARRRSRPASAVWPQHARLQRVGPQGPRAPLPPPPRRRAQAPAALRTRRRSPR